MSKSLDNLTLTQLIELKSCADMIRDFYSENLTNYAIMNSDQKFEHMPPNVAEQHKKRNKANQLSIMIMNEIEEIISEYYVSKD